MFSRAFPRCCCDWLCIRELVHCGHLEAQDPRSPGYWSRWPNRHVHSWEAWRALGRNIRVKKYIEEPGRQDTITNRTKYLLSSAVDTKVQFCGPFPLAVKANTQMLYTVNSFRFISVLFVVPELTTFSSSLPPLLLYLTRYPWITPFWSSKGTASQSTRMLVELRLWPRTFSGGLAGPGGKWQDKETEWTKETYI